MRAYDAKYSECQYQLRAVSPNLMFAKFTHYMVVMYAHS